MGLRIFCEVYYSFQNSTKACLSPCSPCCGSGGSVMGVLGIWGLYYCVTQGQKPLTTCQIWARIGLFLTYISTCQVKTLVSKGLHFKSQELERNSGLEDPFFGFWVCNENLVPVVELPVRIFDLISWSLILESTFIIRENNRYITCGVLFSKFRADSAKTV